MDWIRGPTAAIVLAIVIVATPQAGARRLYSQDTLLEGDFTAFVQEWTVQAVSPSPAEASSSLVGQTGDAARAYHLDATVWTTLRMSAIDEEGSPAQGVATRMDAYPVGEENCVDSGKSRLGDPVTGANALLIDTRERNAVGVTGVQTKALLLPPGRHAVSVDVLAAPPGTTVAFEIVHHDDPGITFHVRQSAEKLVVAGAGAEGAVLGSFESLCGKRPRL